jgi:hypothetical protein
VSIEWQVYKFSVDLEVEANVELLSFVLDVKAVDINGSRVSGERSLSGDYFVCTIAPSTAFVSGYNV